MGMAPYKVTTQKIEDVFGTIELIDELDPLSAAKVWGGKHFDTGKNNIVVNEVADESGANMTIIKNTGLFNKPKFFKLQVVPK